MQPAALKHEYLTSVANAMLHPVAQRPEEGPGPWRIIGWANAERTLPLLLVKDSDGTIRHALPPKPHDLDLIKELQHEDDRWAAAHDTQPRQIRDLLTKPGAVDYVNRVGLNTYEPAPRIHPAEQLWMKRQWFDTSFLPDPFEIVDHGPLDLTPGSPHASKLSHNVAGSVNMNLGPGDWPTVEVPIDRVVDPGTPMERRGALRRSGPVVFAEDVISEPAAGDGPEL